MSAPDELSATMVKALVIARAGEKRLVRWPGGYWMGRPRKPDERAVIGEYAGTNTVDALIARGYVEVIARLSRGDPWIVALTDKAAAFLRTI